eukprot:COSAG02_NODE_1544_length_11996_cov_143.122468_9_plen_67_part_00
MRKLRALLRSADRCRDRYPGVGRGTRKSHARAALPAKMQQLSEVENTQLGVAAGVIEVTCICSEQD